MTHNLPDAPVPRRKQILPAGVVRAKDNVDDFSFSNKNVQAEAEHNMGYYLADLNNRNEELENLVERQDKDLAALRRENHELRERSMKVVVPELSKYQLGLIADKNQEMRHLQGQNSILREQHHCLERRLRTYKIVAGIAVVVALLSIMGGV